MPITIEQFTKELKELAMEKGAALIGVAPVERFDPMAPFNDSPPEGFHPKDYVPSAKSVISIAMPILNPVLDAPARLLERDLEMIPPDVKPAYLDMLYNRVGHVVHDFQLEFISQAIGQFLFKNGYDTMIFPTTGLHPQVEGKTDRVIWEQSGKYSKFGYTFGPFSHRHAATRAGLGEFGYNNIVLTKEYGPRQRFNSIITEAELVADPLITEPICLREKCGYLCIKSCFMNAITRRDDEEVKDYRSITEQVDDSKIFIDTPSKTDPRLCRRRRDFIPNSPVRGDCLRVCPVPIERKNVPTRLKELTDKEMPK